MFRLILDRTAVLFLGVAAGIAIGYAFATGGARRQEAEPAPAVLPAAPPIDAARPDVAPPPPAASPAAPKAAAAVETPPPPTVPISTDGKVRVGVFGDSFGDGIWSGLYRLLPGKDGFSVEKFSQQSTGFTRYARLDLEAHDDERLADAKLDIAVIAFGANDAQGVCDGGKCGKLMGAFWQQVIAARVTSYVAMLRRHGAAVYWVGLPVMRDPAFDADTRQMSEFYRSLMARLDVPFVDIRPLTTASDGAYEAYYDDGAGGQKLLRANDGIHMSMNGYLRVTKGLAQAIRASAADGRKPAETPGAGQ